MSQKPTSEQLDKQGNKHTHPEVSPIGGVGVMMPEPSMYALSRYGNPLL